MNYISTKNTSGIYLILFGLFVTCSASDIVDFRKISYEELVQMEMGRFTQPGVSFYTGLVFDIPHYQLIIGARNNLFRVTLEELRKLENVSWSAPGDNIQTCMKKGQSEEDCQNFIRVLLPSNGKIFTCGTNAFSPSCSWRDINSLGTVMEWVSGVAKCPYSPHYNSTALMTVQGDYYIASAVDFSGHDHAIYRIMGKSPVLRTDQYDPKWLSEPHFIASFEIENFVYFFFRENAVEYINCGKAIYSRVARICKNDHGGQFILKDRWTTFLKARLNCSIPGQYPFYYNEIQGIHYLEREQMFYATFTTNENSIYGSAICAYNMSAIREAFTSQFKYQSNSASSWTQQKNSQKHFQCELPADSSALLDSEKYQLMNDAVQPVTMDPLLTVELQRLNHLVVDVVSTKHHDGIHVIFVVNVEGVIKKLAVSPDSYTTCLVEEIHLFPPTNATRPTIYVMKLLKDTNSLYLGTSDAVLRIPFHRCQRFKSKIECINSMDPYCGWNDYQLACTIAPHRNPLSIFWHQDRIGCPRMDTPVNGNWGPWSSWFECSQAGNNPPGDKCLCQQRECNNPSPVNGGKPCDGIKYQVTNCTQNGQWSEWSAWSSCTQPCGLAVKTRRRTCGNPAPAHGGRVCIGVDRDEIYCTSNPPCPAPTLPSIDGQWSEWSRWDECSAPCGGGVQARQRKCSNPSPQNGGEECLGCSQDFRHCNMHECPEIRKSTNWTPWLKLNITRDGYFEQRFRFSCRANVPGPNAIRIGHMKKEERFCLEGGQSCLDAAFANIDGDWSEWSAWSECSVSCGGGTQYRERACDNPAPSGTGLDCKDISRMTRACNKESCKDVQSWKEWSEWSRCNEEGGQWRERVCEDPKLTSKLAAVSKNPSKPHFNHYLFETLSLSIRIACKANPKAVSNFEYDLFPAFEDILRQDVQEFSPYIFQILSLLLEFNASPVANSYMAIFPCLLSPILWERPGNIHPLVRLLQAYIEKGCHQIVAADKLGALLGVFQKLIASKSNDHEGFYILQSLIEHANAEQLSPFLKQIFILLFQRLQSSKTTKYIKSLLVFFFLFTYKYGPTILITMVDEIQPKMYGMVIERLVIPDVQKVSGTMERKICAIGITKLLTETPQMIDGDYANFWTPLLQVLIGLFELPEDDTIPEDEHFIEIEDTPGYQTAYSQLVFAGRKEYDPFSGTIPDARMNLAQSLHKLSISRPGKVIPLISSGMAQDALGHLQRYLQAAQVQLV